MIQSAIIFQINRNKFNEPFLVFTQDNRILLPEVTVIGIK